jgi:hypothetical protein
MKIISGNEELSAFRNHWDGEKMLALLRQHNGRVLVNWALGSGKSFNIDQVIQAAISTEQYDLVIALFPTRLIIDERQWVKTPPKDIPVVNLVPRNKSNCGTDMDARWEVFEINGLGALGRIELCGRCLREPECAWPRQFGKSLKGTRVIFGTQSNLERNPDFLDQLAKWAGAEKVLVILDEADFIMKSFQRKVNLNELRMFVDVLKNLNTKRWAKPHKKWTYLCELLLSARTEDLCSSDWRMPKFNREWSIAIQTCGYNLHGDSFHFLAFDLMNFCKSAPESRERAGNEDILYASVPGVSHDFIIYSGTAHQKFAEYRLGKEFANPFQDYSFSHPKTTWFNIASRMGMRIYFLKNSSQILDFFANLVARRLLEGKRPLLIAKKCFRDICAREMDKRLHAMGFQAKVATNGWEAGLLKNPNIVPLIHYGMIGTNLFEDFDCAYCLTGFYVKEDAVNGILQDVLSSDIQVPLKITTESRPNRRRAGVLNPSDRFYDVHQLAQHALDHLEMGTVLQTVGRVRPYTKPREVITFQCSEHPGIEYTEEFNGIQGARKYFEIPSKRAAQKKDVYNRVQDAKSKGLKQREAAGQIGVSVRTIKRYWVPPTLLINLLKGQVAPFREQNEITALD